MFMRPLTCRGDQVNGAKLLDLPAERVIVADFTHNLKTLLTLESDLSGRFS